jgi:hypothetical protein
MKEQEGKKECQHVGRQRKKRNQQGERQQKK